MICDLWFEIRNDWRMGLLDIPCNDEQRLYTFNVKLFKRLPFFKKRKSPDTVESDWIYILTVNAREVCFHEFRVGSVGTYPILEYIPDTKLYLEEHSYFLSSFKRKRFEDDRVITNFQLESSSFPQHGNGASRTSAPQPLGPSPNFCNHILYL